MACSTIVLQKECPTHAVDRNETPAYMLPA
jgi:hypothetical protein